MSLPFAPQRLRLSLGPSAKLPLTQADFTYEGCFKLPTIVNGNDMQYTIGITHRYVNGQLRFIVGQHNTYECAFPGLVTDPALAKKATAIRTLYAGNVAGANSYGQTFGIYWDEPSQRLFWGNGHEYNTQYPYNPSVGYSTLDEAAGKLTSVGIWKLNNRSCKMTHGGVTSVPQWFSDKYCPGRRLAAGFGGYFSIATTGPISMGPALSAFNPSDLDAVANKGGVNHTPLVSYAFNAPDRCHRDTDVINDFDNWDPANGIGYWVWTDMMYQGGAWIDTPTKSGIVFTPVISHGRCYYNNSTLNAGSASHSWFMYSADQLAEVATGKKKEWEIQPTFWDVKYPGVTYPLPGFAGASAHMITGSTYDATTQTYYVAVKAAMGRFVGSATYVYAYKVK